MTDIMESPAEMGEPLIENNADEAVVEVSSTTYSHGADGAGGPNNNNNIMPVTLSYLHEAILLWSIDLLLS